MPTKRPVPGAGAAVASSPAATRRRPGPQKLHSRNLHPMTLRLTTAGESHGPGLTCILEGMPAGLRLDRDALNLELRRRQLGYGRGGRMKIERDQVEVTGGVRHGRTLGGPIAIAVVNR